MIRPLAGALLGAVLTASVASAAQAATTVKITLWDKGTAAEMATDKGVGMDMDKTPDTMGLKLSRTSVKAGEVDFKVTNGSKETVHEMVIFPFKDGMKIPYSEKDLKIDEDAAGHLGEVSELEAGKKGELKITLKPGKYLLTCNIPSHYMNGMWAMLTVK